MNEQQEQTAQFISLQDLADRWATDYQTPYRMVRRGELDAFRAGRCWRIRLAAVEQVEAGEEQVSI